MRRLPPRFSPSVSKCPQTKEEPVPCQATVARRPPLMERQARRLPTFHPAGKLGGVKTWPQPWTSSLQRRSCNRDRNSAQASRPGPVLDESFVVAGRLVRERILPRARGRPGRRRRRVTCASDTQRLAEHRALKTSTQATRERTGTGFPALAAADDGEGRGTHYRKHADHGSRCADGRV